MESGKLFIGGISWDTNEDRLREYFQAFGDVVEAVIMKDRITGRARGFGFIVFSDPSVAEKVVKEKHTIDGRNVEAKKAVPRDDQHATRHNGSNPGSPGPARTKKIFVGGLASSVTESDFKKYFDQFGLITDLVVMYDPGTQRPRGFGFITYDSEEAVDKVLYKTFHELNGKRVEVKRAVPKELSPGPTRNQSGGFKLNYPLNRVNEFLNGNAHGYNPSPMEGRFSPISYSTGTGMDSALSSNYSGNGSFSSNIGYERGFGSFYNGPSNRFNGPISRVGSDSMLQSAGWNLWNNESAFGGLGTILGSSSKLGQDGGNGSFDSGKISYNSGDNSFARGPGNAGRNASLYAATKDVHVGASRNLYESTGSSLYEDPTWHSSSPELDDFSSFTYGLGTEDSLSYAGGYSVANRTNRGVAT